MSTVAKPDGSEESAAQSKPSLVGQLLGFAIATAVAAGTGFAGAQFLGLGRDPANSKPAHRSEPKPAVASDEKEKTAEVGKSEGNVLGGAVTKLEPILTNLLDPPGTWVRLELSLVSAEPLSAEMMATVTDDILAYLRTLRLSRVTGPGGFLTLREGLEDRVLFRTEGAAKRVLVRTLLFEQ